MNIKYDFLDEDQKKVKAFEPKLLLKKCLGLEGAKRLDVTFGNFSEDPEMDPTDKKLEKRNRNYISEQVTFKNYARAILYVLKKAKEEKEWVKELKKENPDMEEPFEVYKSSNSVTFHWKGEDLGDYIKLEWY